MPRHSPVAADAVVQDEPERPERRLCEGPCNLLYRKNGRGIAREGDPVLCPKCTSTLRSQISGLDVLVAMLARTADGHRGDTSQDSAIRAHRAPTGKGSPSTAADVTEELEKLLRTWLQVKRPVGARLGYHAAPVYELTSMLLESLHLYLRDPQYADDLREDIRMWHCRLERMTKAGPALVSKPVPCPRCPGKSMSLVQERGADVVKCTECGRIMSVQEYEDLAADGAEATSAAKPDPVKPGATGTEG
jgi:hypothetical protein